MCPGPNDARNDDKGATNKPSIEQAVRQVDRLSGLAYTHDMEGAFIAALQGSDVREIGRYQVYTDCREDETVVFIHEPTGRSCHKYILAVADGHTYIVAVPMEWTEYHKEILARVSAASGSRAQCQGGGYVRIGDNGELCVDRSSGDFGPGDHERAKKALEEAVRRTGERQGTH